MPEAPKYRCLSQYHGDQKVQIPDQTKNLCHSRFPPVPSFLGHDDLETFGPSLDIAFLHMLKWRPSVSRIVGLVQVLQDHQVSKRRQSPHSFPYRCLQLLRNCSILPIVSRQLCDPIVEFCFDGHAHILLRAVEKIIAVLRDGRKLIGVLRSWDQFGMFKITVFMILSLTVIKGNLVLQDTVERYFVHGNKTYADIKRGIYLVRGENVSILGEIVC